MFLLLPPPIDMDYLFLTIVAVAIYTYIYVNFGKLSLHQEVIEISSSSLSLSSSVPPSSLSYNWIHEVFPSFHGKDVRQDFFSHLQKEFQRKEIILFIDNEIERGEFIGVELIRAIRGSKIAIIILSRNFASSKWCLDELVEIMKCRKEFGQTVISIFYKVDPSDVKKMAGDFGMVFRKTCEGKSKEETGRWEEALVKIATIAGYHSNNWDNEAVMIEKIVSDVSNKLINYAPSNDFDGLVGMRARIEMMEPLLSQDSDEVKTIGTSGPFEIGKSTIAKTHSVCMECSRKQQLHKEFSQITDKEDNDQLEVAKVTSVKKEKCFGLLILNICILY